MRKIIFRGFNRKNGCWLHGFYLQNRGHHFVCPDEFADGKSWDDYEIDPSTLGQYIGLKDKDGKAIYEGDILYYRRKRTGEEDKEFYREVTFRNGCFCMYVPDHFVHSGLHNHIINGILDWEVVGNVIDNPEMVR